MTAAERFRRSYFRNGRQVPAQTKPEAARVRLPDINYVCPVCNIPRRGQERGAWLADGRVFRHFECVSQEFLDAHIERWGPSSLSEKVRRAKVLKGGSR